MSIDVPDTTPIPHTYPVNIIVAGRPCLVVGGGRIAAHKVRGLQNAGADVTVVSPEVVSELAVDPDVRWIARRYESGDVEGHRLVITATGVEAVDAAVATDAREAGILVNSADDPPNCDFILPAVVRAGDLTATISTRGRSPAVATWLRKRLELQLDTNYEGLLDLASKVRAELKTAAGTSEHPGWGAALDSAFLYVQAGDVEAALFALRNALGLEERTIEHDSALLEVGR